MRDFGKHLTYRWTLASTWNGDGLRRLSLEQLYKAADHFIRRNWGKHLNIDGYSIEWTGRYYYPQEYINQLVGEIVVQYKVNGVAAKCKAAYEQFHEIVGG